MAAAPRMLPLAGPDGEPEWGGITVRRAEWQSEVGAGLAAEPTVWAAVLMAVRPVHLAARAVAQEHLPLVACALPSRRTIAV